MTDYSSARSGAVAASETGSLIAASKVEGTKVYNRQGKSLDSIYDVMIDKRSGQVAYAVMSFGGFLGDGRELSSRYLGTCLTTTNGRAVTSSISIKSGCKTLRIMERLRRQIGRAATGRRNR